MTIRSGIKPEGGTLDDLPEVLLRTSAQRPQTLSIALDIEQFAEQLWPGSFHIRGPKRPWDENGNDYVTLAALGSADEFWQVWEEFVVVVTKFIAVQADADERMIVSWRKPPEITKDGDKVVVSCRLTARADPAPALPPSSGAT